MILAVETSCDDTCAAVVTHDGGIRSNVIASQGLLHARYGGVVPEIASRRHLELLDAVIADSLESGGASIDDVDTRYAETEFDLTVNISSFSEMKPETVDNYLAMIDTRSRYFYIRDAVGKYLDGSLNAALGAENVVVNPSPDAVSEFNVVDNGLAAE